MRSVQLLTNPLILLARPHQHASHIGDERCNRCQNCVPVGSEPIAIIVLASVLDRMSAPLRHGNLPTKMHNRQFWSKSVPSRGADQEGAMPWNRQVCSEGCLVLTTE